MQFTGKITVRVDGEEVRSVGNGTFNPGGVNRSTVKGGGRIHGYTEEEMEPTLSFRVSHTKGTSVKRVSAWRDVTVLAETDTGMRFIFREAWTTEPAELDASTGEISVSMAAIECEED